MVVGGTTTTYTVNQMVNGYAFVKLASLDLPVGLVTLRLVPNGTGKVSADGIKLVNAPKLATQYSIYTDHLNAPSVITNAAGQLMLRQDLTDPFWVTPPNQNHAGIGAFTMNLHLPGQFYDSASGLFQVQRMPPKRSHRGLNPATWSRHTAMSIFSDQLSVKYSTANRTLDVRHADSQMNPDPLVSVRPETYEKMNLEEFATFIGLRILLLMPAMRIQFADDIQRMTEFGRPSSEPDF